MLAAFLSLMPADLGYRRPDSNYQLYLWLHWGILLWLAIDFWRHSLLRLRFVIAMFIATLGMSLKVQRCPHSTTWMAFGQELVVIGKPCNNPQVFRPWWWQR